MHGVYKVRIYAYGNVAVVRALKAGVVSPGLREEQLPALRSNWNIAARFFYIFRRFRIPLERIPSHIPVMALHQLDESSVSYSYGIAFSSLTSGI